MVGHEAQVSIFPYSQRPAPSMSGSSTDYHRICLWYFTITSPHVSLPGSSCRGVDCTFRKEVQSSDESGAGKGSPSLLVALLHFGH